MDALTPIAPAFVSRPTDLLSPGASPWERLARRVGSETREELPSDAPAMSEPDWQDAVPDLSYAILARDVENERVSMLVRLGPGAAYPPHTHAGVEELYLLDGALVIEGRTLYPGAYNRAEAGTSDQHVWSETGCTCVLLTSTRDILR